MTYKIDSSFNIFGTYMQDYSEKLLYKLDAEQGEQWVLEIYQDSTQVYGYEMARVEKIEDGELIYNSGIYTTFRVFVYYYAFDSTDTSGLARYGDVLAYGFGLWGRGGGDLFESWKLKGCVINDTLYGDTTNIITNVKDLSETFPVHFDLFQNYPNPFNPSTQISFAIKESGFTTLKVYNSLGEDVANLFNEFADTGYYNVTFDARYLPSGMYIYSLTSGNYIQNRKMLLLK